jgi:Asp-tRNA(Asn)/Glu-tRNA(Gln) amidotransferase A subunit family amidase
MLAHTTELNGKHSIMQKPLNEMSATEIVTAVHSGKTTCEAVALACLDRIEERQPQVQAWQHLQPSQVIEYARALDKSGKRGALTGVPFGVKDVIDTSTMPTEYGSPIYRGHRPKSDAACVALSRKAGAVLMGKTVTTEFANRHPGCTRHPLDPSRTPGGSSSGSAAAVADRMVPLTIGTQTSGSTIKPGSFCGVFAYRPTHDDLRCAGLKESAHSLDTLGVFARSIEDVALYRDVLIGVRHEPLPDISQCVPRIGFCRTHHWPKVEAATQKLFEEAAQTLGRAGATVAEVVLPEEFARIDEAHQSISSFEFSRNFTWEIENHWDEISDTLRNGRLKKGLECSFERYSEARELAQRCRGLLSGIFEKYDVLLTSPVVGEAPVGLTSTGDSSLCVLWTTMLVPVVGIPVFTGPSGLPVGAQLVGKWNGDRKLLSVAQWIHARLT